MGKNANIIGVDLGGTSIRAGKVVAGEIVKTSKSNTPATGTENEVLEELYDTIRNCMIRIL